YHADRNDIVGLGDDCFGGHRHHRIEIPSRESIAEIAEIVGEKGLDHGEVGTQRSLNQIALSVDFDALLSVLHRRSETRLRQDAAQAVPSRTNPLDKRTLGNEFNLQFAVHHLALSFGIEAYVTDDRLAHKFC